MIVLTLLAQITALYLKEADLLKRGVKRPIDCLSSSCPKDEPNAFESNYELGAPIMTPSPVFKCTERTTGIEYVCKFPRIDHDINELPAEITVLEAIKKSDGNKKDLFVEIHDYFALEGDLSILPQVLRDSNFMASNPKIRYRGYVKIYVEVLKFYDENWMDGFNYVVDKFIKRSEDNKTTVFKRLVSGIIDLQSLGYSHGDIKRIICISNID